jgi:Primase C terminal 1 (PriCT-1)
MWAQRFPEAPAVGFIAGPRSRITVLDVDSTDEKIFADALSRHGDTPFKTRTGSGKFHAYYGYGGESRHIRPFDGLPIDILGGGVAIAPPSSVLKGSYTILRGGRLDDLDRLPLAKGLTDDDLHQPQHQPHQPIAHDTGLVHKGHRHDALFRHCMQHAKFCDDFDALLDVARTFNNEHCMPPIEEDSDVIKTAKSAWSYTERDQNYFCEHGAFMRTDDVTRIDDPDAGWLLVFLRAHNLPTAKFWCSNELAKTFRWDRERLAAARRRLIELGLLKQVKKPWRGSPALFEFPIINRQKAKPASRGAEERCR